MRQVQVLVMTNQARVEVLHEGTTTRFVYWQNHSGSLRLFRRHGEDHWVAQIGGQMLLEREEIDENVHLINSTVLRAASAESLVALLAMQENVHALLDTTCAWGRGAEALQLQPPMDVPVRPDEIAE